MKKYFIFLVLLPLICKAQVIHLGCGSSGKTLNSISVDLPNKTITDWNGNKFKGIVTDEKIEWHGEFNGNKYYASINRYTGIMRNEGSNQQECKQVTSKKF